MSSRKAQLEIMGLAIVVLLISLAMLFVLSFMVTREPEQAKQTFTSNQMATNAVSALMLTTSTCNDLTVTELIQDCGDVVSSFDCDGDSFADSCDEVLDIAEQVFRDTLSVWQKDYMFTVNRGPDELVRVQDVDGNGCPLDRDVGSAFIPGRASGGSKIFVRLELCEHRE
jgi:hypothetical protein